jgi:hypothetical protein
MSSTATTPTGLGSAQSGSVSGLFNYWNSGGPYSGTDTFTKDDFEVEGQFPTLLELRTSTNPNSAGGNTQTGVSESGMDSGWDLYQYVWTSSARAFYFNGVLISTHTTNIPSSPAQVMMNHWGTNSANLGGVATAGTRWLYIPFFAFTPQ